MSDHEDEDWYLNEYEPKQRGGQVRGLTPEQERALMYALTDNNAWSPETYAAVYKLVAAMLDDAARAERGPCPSCERDLSYPGQPGHECYTLDRHAANIARTERDEARTTLAVAEERERVLREAIEALIDDVAPLVGTWRDDYEQPVPASSVSRSSRPFLVAALVRMGAPMTTDTCPDCTGPYVEDMCEACVGAMGVGE